MPLYLVRWADLRISLVCARNEDDLVDQLAADDDPGACRWTIYDGPLWIDVDLPVRIKAKTPSGAIRSEADFDVSGVEKIDIDDAMYDLSFGGEAPLSGTRDSLTKWALPHVHAVVERAGEGEVDRDALAAAVRSELRELLQHQWRADQLDRRTDDEAATLKTYGFTMAPPWLRRQMNPPKRPPGGRGPRPRK